MFRETPFLAPKNRILGPARQVLEHDLLPYKEGVTGSSPVSPSSLSLYMSKSYDSC